MMKFTNKWLYNILLRINDITDKRGYYSNNVDEMYIKSKLYSKDIIDTKISNILFCSYSDIEKKLLIENKEEVIDKLTKFIQLNIPDVSSLYQMNLIVESNMKVNTDNV